MPKKSKTLKNAEKPGSLRRARLRERQARRIEKTALAGRGTATAINATMAAGARANGVVERRLAMIAAQVGVEVDACRASCAAGKTELAAVAVRLELGGT
jgi:hypothetical protein